MTTMRMKPTIPEGPYPQARLWPHVGMTPSKTRMRIMIRIVPKDMGSQTLLYGLDREPPSLFDGLLSSLPNRGGKRRSNSFLTVASAVTNAHLQASDMRLGSGRANQFGSCPKLPTWTKATPLSLAHSFKERWVWFPPSPAISKGLRRGVLSTRRRVCKGAH